MKYLQTELSFKKKLHGIVLLVLAQFVITTDLGLMLIAEHAGDKAVYMIPTVLMLPIMMSTP